MYLLQMGYVQPRGAQNNQVLAYHTKHVMNTPHIKKSFIHEDENMINTSWADLQQHLLAKDLVHCNLSVKVERQLKVSLIQLLCISSNNFSSALILNQERWLKLFSENDLLVALSIQVYIKALYQNLDSMPKIINNFQWCILNLA